MANRTIRTPEKKANRTIRTAKKGANVTKVTSKKKGEFPCAQSSVTGANGPLNNPKITLRVGDFANGKIAVRINWPQNGKITARAPDQNLKKPEIGEARFSAIRAGYSEETARQQGSRLLTNVDVAEAIAKAQSERVGVETGNASEACRRAYDCERMGNSAVNTEAKKLLKNPPITLRVDTLQAHHQERHDVTVDGLTNELETAIVGSTGRSIRSLVMRCWRVIAGLTAGRKKADETMRDEAALRAVLAEMAADYAAGRATPLSVEQIVLYTRGWAVGWLPAPGHFPPFVPGMITEHERRNAIAVLNAHFENHARLISVGSA